MIDINGVKVMGTFEVFNSKGGWAFLLGKPSLTAFKAVHDYGEDTINIRDEQTNTTLNNQIHAERHRQIMGPSSTLDVKQREQKQGGDDPPSRQVTPESVTNVANIANPTPHANTTRHAVETAEQPKDVFTRQTDSFNPRRIEHILNAVTLGDTLNPQERQKAKELITEYADVFACTLSEVLPLRGVYHNLNVPHDAKLSTKFNQRPLSAPQKEYFHKWTNQMLEAGLIEQAPIEQIQHIAPTVLTQKTHDATGGMTLEDLQRALNEQCEAAGIAPQFNPPPTSEKPSEELDERPKGSFKWRVTQNFGELNKITQIPAVQHGDIRAKQQRLSGHTYVSVFDFAAGFYAIEVPDEWRPYLAFYVEGMGYFWYERMAMGLTGAPSTFTVAIAERLHRLMADNTLELFVDDGGCAADTFTEMVDKLRRVFNECREHKLSLSPSKSRFFMNETVFAGATVGPQGVQPDIAKLSAIINWKQPSDALNLSSFLGLTGHFRDLIKDYARKEKPLRDLLAKVELPKPLSKIPYRKAMTKFPLAEHWTPEHTKAFINLKVTLTEQPVLHAPEYDGTPFIITTDGCQEGFGACLAQKTRTQTTEGKWTEKIRPIGFASKRTSEAEQKYQPFVLELAALKYGLDKFADITWGFPIEIETDCQAVRDIIFGNTISKPHARWRDGIISHNIAAVRHVAGKLNTVADGLSRKWEGTPRTEGDGSEWAVNPEPEEILGVINDVYAVHTAEKIHPQHDKLRARFDNEPLFKEVVDALLNLDTDIPIRERTRARSRASQYMLDGGKLWRIHRGTSVRPRSRVECITKEEARNMATRMHAEGGHWGRDALKIALTDRIYSPKLDMSVMTAIQECAKCKNFGSTHLHALLNPITRRHPFELLVGDYLSMPTGKGGYHTLGLFLDTFSQHLWVTKFKTAGTAKTTIDSLKNIFHNFAAPDTFMTDGGSHFNNAAVKEFCEQWSCKHHVVAAYSPWVNGLVEGTNKLLLHVLKRLCAPNLGENDQHAVAGDKLPRSWPDHLDDADRALNNRILPALKYTPKELLLGMVVDTRRTDPDNSARELTKTDIAIHMAYAAQQRLDGYDEAVQHAIKRKATFDKRVLKRHPGEVIFTKGQLIQIYRNDLDYTFKTERKILPKWSEPHRITERLSNSYKIATLSGIPLAGEFSARRLRAFIPRTGTELDRNQRGFMEQMGKAQEEQPGKGRTGEDRARESETEEEEAQERESDEEEVVERGSDEGRVGEREPDEKRGVEERAVSDEDVAIF